MFCAILGGSKKGGEVNFKLFVQIPMHIMFCKLQKCLQLSWQMYFNTILIIEMVDKSILYYTRWFKTRVESTKF